MKLRERWFTFIEVVVMITIVGILWIIWFIWLQSYLSDTRDSHRMIILNEMRKSLVLFKAKESKLAKPEWSAISISASGSHILTQWDFPEHMMLETTGLTWNIVDPLDGTHPMYTLTSDEKYAQVGLFLEAEDFTYIDHDPMNSISQHSKIISENVYAADRRIFMTQWSVLWVIMTGTEVPVNQDSSQLDELELDNTITHIAYLDNVTKVEESGAELSKIVKTAVQAVVDPPSSCKTILERGLWNIDGEYTIYNNNQPIQVYCDMSTDWWGWTKLTEDLIMDNNLLTFENKNKLCYELKDTIWDEDTVIYFEWTCSFDSWSQPMARSVIRMPFSFSEISGSFQATQHGWENPAELWSNWWWGNWHVATPAYYGSFLFGVGEDNPTCLQCGLSTLQEGESEEVVIPMTHLPSSTETLLFEISENNPDWGESIYINDMSIFLR